MRCEICGTDLSRDLFAVVTGERVCSICKLKFIGGMYWTAPPGPDDKISGGGGFAFTVWMFGTLVTNPLCEKLGGPCARCGNYYIKKRASQKVYCSRRCGNAATAVARTAKRDAAERKDKLLRAKVAICEWRSAKPQQDWKSWVAQKTGIDLRFLTRAVNKGDLVPPKSGLPTTQDRINVARVVLGLAKGEYYQQDNGKEAARILRREAL